MKKLIIDGLIKITAGIRKRMTNEEKVLSEGLEGYREYMKKVKYRIIPFTK